MAEKQITFEGFPLDSRGDVFGAFPSVDVIQERSKDLINGVVRNINQMTIDYCLKFNIDPDVLVKQKAEIDLLKMKNDKATSLLRRVIEWADWQSGSKCPSFQDIEKDIKAFLE